MSNLQNEQIKENLYEDLLDRGYSDDQILGENMVDKLFFNECTMDDIVSEFKPDIDDDDYDDSMDGDHASALASAGYGTDEDYGDYGECY